MPTRIVLATVLAALVLVVPAAEPPARAAAGPVSAGSPPVRDAGPATGWTLPLAGPLQVARPFDPPESRYGAGHRGVDLAGFPGVPVLAAGAGTVVFAGMVAGRPVVSVAHAGGLRTTYEPVQPTVTAGQAVARGSPLGVLLTGHPGCPAAACLHWGLLRGSGAGEVYLDPLLRLHPPRITLLPVGLPAP